MAFLVIMPLPERGEAVALAEPAAGVGLEGVDGQAAVVVGDVGVHLTPDLALDAVVVGAVGREEVQAELRPVLGELLFRASYFREFRDPSGISGALTGAL